MPLALEPGGRHPVVLKCDENKPEESRPTFYFKALNGRKWREASGKLDALAAAKSGSEAYDSVIECLKMALVGWDHMTDPETGEAIPYDHANLDLLVNGPESVELLKGMLDVGSASRKNSE